MNQVEICVFLPTVRGGAQNFKKPSVKNPRLGGDASKLRNVRAWTRDSPCTVKKILAVLCGVVDTWHWYSPSSDGCGLFSRTTQSSECGRWNASNLCACAWLVDSPEQKIKRRETRNQSSFTALFYRPACSPAAFLLQPFTLTLGENGCC